ncbi:FHA domain-containing protein [Sorangium sp. So ce119]|uniref:FHA domain-containing protein n=1 Tax=Sorangium sp. So ce119 TaxID=3133279 RepID=UPI003F614FE8
MSKSPSSAKTQSLHRGEPSGGDLDAAAYLLVIDGSSSRRCPLPREGVLFVGRSTDAEICVTAAAASRRHAKFLVVDGEVQLVDMKSHVCSRFTSAAPVGAGRLARSASSSERCRPPSTI